MKENIIHVKSYAFALRTISLYKYLIYTRKEFVLSNQILKSGTSIGALVKESEFAQSKADFINKMQIALKEANETEYWLMLLMETDYITIEHYNQIAPEIKEIIAILVAIVKNSKINIEKLKSKK